MTNLDAFANEPFAATLQLLVDAEDRHRAPLDALLFAVKAEKWNRVLVELMALRDLPCGVLDTTLDVLIGWANFSDTVLSEERRYERAKLAWNRVVQDESRDAMFVAAASSLGWVYEVEGKAKHAALWRRLSAEAVKAQLAA